MVAYTWDHWDYYNWDALWLSLGLCAPFVVIGAIAQLQMALTGNSEKWFAESPLARACWVIGVVVVSIDLLTYVGAFLALFAVPSASSLLAMSWVQPQARHAAWTRVAGAVGCVFIVWFVARADESPIEGVLAAAGTVVVVARLVIMRRRNGVPLQPRV